MRPAHLRRFFSTFPGGAPGLGLLLLRMATGSVQGTFLVVDDIKAAHTQLLGNGVEVSDVFHFAGGLIRAAGTNGRVLGPDPEARSCFSFASVSDPSRR